MGSQQQTTRVRQVDLPTPVLNMAQHITREVSANSNRPMVQFVITVIYDEGRAIYTLTAADGKVYRLGVVE